MKILVLKGSPHKFGTSNTIADKFIKGARESGHEVSEIDIAKSNLHPCLGCDMCGMSGNCIQKDDGNTILSKMFEYDLLVFVTPVYYFGMSAQLKILIDRFYARNGKITSKRFQSVLIAAAWNNDNVVMSAIEKHFEIIFDYLHMKTRGMILAKGSGTPGMIPSHYLDEAYNLGKNI